MSLERSVALTLLRLKQHYQTRLEVASALLRKVDTGRELDPEEQRLVAAYAKDLS